VVEFCAVSSTVLPAIIFGSLFYKVGAAVQIKIIIFIMIFIDYIYKYSYSTRETINQIGVALPEALL
jgi:hypothetical protein